jgi:hypothetical protein
VTFPSFTRTASQIQGLALAVLPHGGQHAARKNAWAAMSEGSARARMRTEADAAMSRAAALSARKAASAR